MSVNEELSLSTISNTLDILRLDVTERNRVLRVLRQLERDLSIMVADSGVNDVTRSDAKRRRLESLLKEARLLIDSNYRDISKDFNTVLGRMYLADQVKTASDMNNIIGVDLISVSVNAQQARVLAGNTLIEGSTARDWWAGQSNNLKTRFTRTMRQGLLLNESTSDLVRRVRGTRENDFKDGIMNNTYNQAKSLVRTSLISVNNQSKIDLYESNSDVIKAIQWSSTLDSRTTLICMSLDGLTWDIITKKPIGHDKPFPGNTAHFGERSTQIPVLKTANQISRSSGSNKRKINKLTEPQRTSIDGEVPATTTYEQFLKNKPKSFQVKALGAERQKLFEEGKLPFSKLIDQSHRPLTIDQLESRT